MKTLRHVLFLLLLTTGIQLTSPKLQREFIARLADHEIAGLGFGTGLAHRRLPAALLTAARAHDFPLFEVPYELPFIAITERAFAHLAWVQWALGFVALAIAALCWLGLQPRIREYRG